MQDDFLQARIEIGLERGRRLRIFGSLRAHHVVNVGARVGQIGTRTAARPPSLSTSSSRSKKSTSVSSVSIFCSCSPRYFRFTRFPNGGLASTMSAFGISPRANRCSKSLPSTSQHSISGESSPERRGASSRPEPWSDRFRSQSGERTPQLSYLDSSRQDRRLESATAPNPAQSVSAGSRTLPATDGQPQR